MSNQSHNTSDTKSFTRQQYEFAAHIRDPQKNPCPPGVEDRRMAIYRELFFNNVEDFMTSSYPVLHSVLGEARWQKLVRDFYAEHRAETPLFPRLPAEFLNYVNEVRRPQAGDPTFMLELAHYEWMELAAAQSGVEIDWNTVDRNGDLLNGHPVVSPLAWVLSYNFPVHRISAEFQPQEPDKQATHIIVYRDENDDVGFIEISPMTAVLLSRLEQDTSLTGKAALLQLAREMNHPDVDMVVNGGLEILGNLQQRNIILGTRVHP